MIRFKVGDRVRARRDHVELKANCIYTVTAVDLSDDHMVCDLLHCDGLGGSYLASRFELVLEPAAGHRDKLNALLDGMGDDELKVMLYVAKRIDHGRAEYGGLNISRGDWRKELAEEQADSIVYVACDAIKRYLDADPLK